MYGKRFKQPVIEGSLDSLSTIYACLGVSERCSMAVVFVAELAMGICTRNMDDSMKDLHPFIRHYLPLAAHAREQEW